MFRECYWCERTGNTDEHGPPKCLFPDQKDSGCIDYRRDRDNQDRSRTDIGL